jgi:hypothetical protein
MSLSPTSYSLLEIDEMLEKIYANQSACHIKKGNWKRAIEAADKVSKFYPLCVMHGFGAFLGAS